MKYLLILLVFLALEAKTQNFILSMDVEKYDGKTTTYWKNEKVVWVNRNSTSIILWDEHSPLILRRYRTVFKASKEVRNQALAWRYIINKEGRQPYEVLKDVYIDKNQNLYLIKVVNNKDTKGLLIYINRLNKENPFPYYMFTWKT